jgi:hypothetical protein
VRLQKSGKAGEFRHYLTPERVITIAGGPYAGSDARYIFALVACRFLLSKSAHIGDVSLLKVTQCRAILYDGVKRSCNIITED